MSAANVVVEVIALQALPDRPLLGYRVVHVPWEPGTTPDQLALDAVGIVPAPDRWAVSHSTSWRFEPPGTVYLTYAVIPDPSPPSSTTVLTQTGVVCSGDPLLPTPPELHTHHVAAHAVRHLAYLGETDPAIRAAATKAPRVWAAITHYAESVPVGTHGEVHAMAEVAAIRQPAAP